MNNPGSEAASPRPTKRRRLERVTAACDLCKARKVKCDGQKPCAYCIDRDRASSCVFSGPRIRDTTGARRYGARSSTPPAREQNGQHRDEQEQQTGSPQGHDDHDTTAALSPATTRATAHSDDRQSAAVPLEGRLLRDAQGKTIFIGDSAPLSFLQTVKHLVTCEIDPSGFQLQGVRDSVIEAASAHHAEDSPHSVPVVPSGQIDRLLNEFLVATTGLIDLFNNQTLPDFIRSGLSNSADPVAQAVCHLVLAIGAQGSDETKALAWFLHARKLLLAKMCNNMTVSTVQGFTLLTMYMLRAFQPNGAYLFLSLAARSAYAIGIHRAEANASFGHQTGLLRDRIWKSLRCVDMLISNTLGRPPSTSDIDCTVQYRVAEPSHNISNNILDASVQIFMILEQVVVEVYSRKRISLRIANFVSHQLKTWAVKWLRPLTTALSSSNTSDAVQIGACQTLTSYFYCITLLTRPFLLYDLYETLGAGAMLKRSSNQVDHADKRKFADAALDAAVACVEMVTDVIRSGHMPSRMPLIVSWLFSTSLVLALGVMGQGSPSFEQPCRNSIACLDFFAPVDPHARQYSLIAQNLLSVALAHLERREVQSRSLRKQASSQLFGLLSPETTESRAAQSSSRLPASARPPYLPTAPTPVSDSTMYDGDFFNMPWPHENDAGLQDFLQPVRQGSEGALVDIPLFPMDDNFALLLGTDGQGGVFDGSAFP